MKKNISFPDTLKSIGRALQQHELIEELVLPDRVAIIESYALQGCSELRSITLGKGIEIIDDNAFEDCCSLRLITSSDPDRHIYVDADELEDFSDIVCFQLGKDRSPGGKP